LGGGFDLGARSRSVCELLAQQRSRLLNPRGAAAAFAVRALRTFPALEPLVFGLLRAGALVEGAITNWRFDNGLLLRLTFHAPNSTVEQSHIGNKSLSVGTARTTDYPAAPCYRRHDRILQFSSLASSLHPTACVAISRR
jgi:hypothetical protein